jgi:hypothetical protein
MTALLWGTCAGLIGAEATPAGKPGGPAGAAGRVLADERWVDRAYGMSLQPPLGVKMVSQSADDYLLRIADEAGIFTMSAAVKHSRSPLTLAKVVDQAQKQVQGAQGVAQLVSQKPVQLAGRPGNILYFNMPLGKSGQAMFAQAVVQLTPTTYAVFEANCEFQHMGKVQPLFESMLQTLEIVDPRELDKQREAALGLGQQFRTGLTLKQIHAALVDEQYYRMLELGKDIGYMRVRQQAGKKDGKNAVGIELQYRFAMAGGWIDLLANYWLFDDDSSEQWTITTTRRFDRPVGGGAAGAAVTKETFVETGIRAGQTLTITLDAPAGHKQHAFEVPRVGYLSQVESLMLAQLLPIDRPATYGFYCYHSNLGRITYRTDQVTPALTGFTLSTTLSPNEPAIRSSYDSSRRLTEKALSPERTLTPTSAQEIQRLWRGR